MTFDIEIWTVYSSKPKLQQKKVVGIDFVRMLQR